MTRGETAEILYRFTILQKGNDTDFLLSQSDRQMAQIEVYMQSGKVALAADAAQMAFDLAQQALSRKHALAHAQAMLKLAEAYQSLIQAFAAGIQKNFDQVKILSDQAITTATAAWEADHDVQPLARHIKDRAREIAGQIK